MGDEFQVDTALLRGVAADLTEAGDAAGTTASGLTATPDAGQSTHEVAASLQALRDAVSAIGSVISGDGTELVATAADYDASDLGAQGSFPDGAGPVR